MDHWFYIFADVLAQVPVASGRFWRYPSHLYKQWSTREEGRLHPVRYFIPPGGTTISPSSVIDRRLTA
ncbi:hypothetical protein NG726_01250 [Pseudomonas sp. MOB-449]|nr:hypothetical protein [Pseudomonas sp. MOB-449]